MGYSPWGPKGSDVTERLTLFTLSGVYSVTCPVFTLTYINSFNPHNSL